MPPSKTICALSQKQTPDIPPNKKKGTEKKKYDTEAITLIQRRLNVTVNYFRHERGVKKGKKSNQIATLSFYSRKDYGRPSGAAT